MYAPLCFVVVVVWAAGWISEATLS